MLVKDCMIEAKPVTHGMLVNEVFAECGRNHTHALPFVDEQGYIKGRVTLKNIMKFACLPEYMVDLAPLLGGFMSCVENAQDKVLEILHSPIDGYVREAHECIDPDEPAIKALSIMEKNDTSYLFVVSNAKYIGIITIQGIADKMSKIELSA